MPSLKQVDSGRRSGVFLLLPLLLVLTSAFADEPSFHSGDVIFHSSTSRQSLPIMWASKSLYSHVGIVEVDRDKKYVIEAISKVSRTPLEQWIHRGRFGRYSVFRYQGISVEKQNAVVARAKEYLGRAYDKFFTFENDDIYCSELVYLAFQKVGMPIGKVQKVKDLDVDNALVRRLVEKRWRDHPICKAIKSFGECWSKILEDELVTPIALSKDPHMKEVWSNYP